MTPLTACVEIRIGDDPMPLWVRQRTLDESEGAIMPELDHDISGHFPSYAHLWPCGDIMRFGRRIGRREDIRVVEG